MTVHGDSRGCGFSDSANPIVIKRLTAELIHKYKTALADINDLLKQLSPNCARFNSFSELEHILENPYFLSLAAIDTKTDKVIGIGSLLFQLMLSETSAHIGDIVVDENHRGKNIGETIMESLIDLIKERKGYFTGRTITHIGLTSHPSRESANKLYKKLGFKIRETNVYKLDI